MFDIENIAFTLPGYPISYVELIGTLFGLVSVYWASRTNILTWPSGIVNEIAFFILFYQVQLYSDMILQVFFFAATIYGWLNWRKRPNKKTISSLTNQSKLSYVIIIALGTALLGFFIMHIHHLLPFYFPVKASFPFIDAFTTTASIVATLLLAQKKIETWLIWIVVDLFCIILYFIKGIPVVAIEYIVFLILCLLGWRNWLKEIKHD